MFWLDGGVESFWSIYIYIYISSSFYTCFKAKGVSLNLRAREGSPRQQININTIARCSKLISDFIQILQGLSGSSEHLPFASIVWINSALAISRQSMFFPWITNLVCGATFTPCNKWFPYEWWWSIGCIAISYLYGKTPLNQFVDIRITHVCLKGLAIKSSYV